jgi:carbamoylphosphate synthase small subunit
VVSSCTAGGDSHWASTRGTLASWLADEGVLTFSFRDDSTIFVQVPFIEGVDTRALTQLLRGSGSLPGIVSTSFAAPRPTAFVDVNRDVDLVSLAQVSASPLSVLYSYAFRHSLGHHLLLFFAAA